MYTNLQRTCQEVRQRPRMSLEHFGQMRKCGNVKICFSKFTVPKDNSDFDLIGEVEQGVVLKECLSGRSLDSKVSFFTFWHIQNLISYYFPQSLINQVICPRGYHVAEALLHYYGLDKQKRLCAECRKKDSVSVAVCREMSSLRKLLSLTSV